MTDELLLSVKEVARRLSVGQTKVYELMKSGELPTVRIGGLRRISAAALREWVERRSSDEREERAG